jgi:hypothetical protein
VAIETIHPDEFSNFLSQPSFVVPSGYAKDSNVAAIHSIGAEGLFACWRALITLPKYNAVNNSKLRDDFQRFLNTIEIETFVITNLRHAQTLMNSVDNYSTHEGSLIPSSVPLLGYKPVTGITRQVAVQRSLTYFEFLKKLVGHPAQQERLDRAVVLNQVKREGITQRIASQIDVAKEFPALYEASRHGAFADSPFADLVKRVLALALPELAFDSPMRFSTGAVYEQGISTADEKLLAYLATAPEYAAHLRKGGFSELADAVMNDYFSLNPLYREHKGRRLYVEYDDAGLLKEKGVVTPSVKEVIAWYSDEKLYKKYRNEMLSFKTLRDALKRAGWDPRKGRSSIVPNDIRKARGIIVSATCTIRASLLVLDSMNNAIKASPLAQWFDPTDQMPQRRRLLTDPKVGTTDLQDASDNLRDAHVKLLPPSWRRAVEAVRLSTLEINGRELKISRLGGMGEGHTFPAQSVIHWGICAAAIMLWRDPSILEKEIALNDIPDGITVFGDDISVSPRSGSTKNQHAAANHGLRTMGLKVNRNKTFLAEGPFAEGCGVYVFRKDGVIHEVTPLRFSLKNKPDDLRSFSSFVDKANDAFIKGHLPLYWFYRHLAVNHVVCTKHRGLPSFSSNAENPGGALLGSLHDCARTLIWSYDEQLMDYKLVRWVVSSERNSLHENRGNAEVFAPSTLRAKLLSTRGTTRDAIGRSTGLIVSLGLKSPPRPTLGDFHRFLQILDSYGNGDLPDEYWDMSLEEWDRLGRPEIAPLFSRHATRTRERIFISGHWLNDPRVVSFYEEANVNAIAFGELPASGHAVTNPLFVPPSDPEWKGKEHYDRVHGDFRGLVADALCEECESSEGELSAVMSEVFLKQARLFPAQRNLRATGPFDDKGSMRILSVTVNWLRWQPVPLDLLDSASGRGGSNDWSPQVLSELRNRYNPSHVNGLKTLQEHEDGK